MMMVRPKKVSDPVSLNGRMAEMVTILFIQR